jgi:hypothetical protein
VGADAAVSLTEMTGIKLCSLRRDPAIVAEASPQVQPRPPVLS